MTLTHLSLFTGIGGLDLAAEAAGFETIGQCEWADYPTKVLEKHWPNVPRWRDIHDLSADDFRRRTGIERPTVISGGFPCQPHSCAGKRMASLDERDLWPEMRRVISEIRPKWVLGENVPGLLSSESGRFFRGILRDFAEMGYDAGWCVISAASVGAIHRRERLAVIAHASSKRLEGSFNWEQKIYGAKTKLFEVCTPQPTIGENDLPKSVICGTDNGIPAKVYRLKCLGNAVVPAQFYPFFAAIAEIERSK
jgi:DNA (cytosine-5)-methyltransferase 1